MLSFILGGPKSGKSSELIRRITDDLSQGKKVLFLVPEQEAVSAERRIVSSQEASKSLFLLETANFSRLPNIVFRMSGGICYNYISNGGRALMMYRALSELGDSLSTYKTGDSADITLVSSLIGLYSQLADYRISPLMLEDSTIKLPDTLRSRAEDIATIYTRYDELIHDGFDSDKDDLIKVARIIREQKLFCDTNVYIDSFTGYTPAELEVIDALLSIGSDVTVTLCIDNYRDTELFENLFVIRDKLISFAEKYGAAVDSFECIAKERGAEFEYIAKFLYDLEFAESYTDRTKDITFTEADDIYNECELICADIIANIKKGMRYRDITVVCGNAADYSGILDVIMQRHNIPCRLSVSREVLNSVCVKLIICALNIIIYNWRLSDVITYIKTGLCGITDEECDIIEEYACTWNLSGSVWTMDEEWSMNPKGYTQNITKNDTAMLDRINKIRARLTQPLTELSEALKADRRIDSSCKAIYEFLSTLVDPDSLIGEDIASWNAVIEALEQLSLCGNDLELTNIDNLKRLIRLICSQISFSMLPSTIDEINVSSITSLRSIDAERVYIIGANEGSYPACSSESNILDDRMRQAFTDAGLVMPHDPDQLYREQNFLFYKTLLSAKKSVWISRPVSGLDGNERVIAPALAELKRILPSLNVIKNEDIGILDRIYDKASAFDMISDPCFGYDILNVLRADPDFKDAADSFYTTISTKECSLTSQKNLDRLKGDMPMSQTRLEQFVKCKFAYALEYGLRLNEQAKVNYDPRDIGNFIHKILEDYLRISKNKPLKDKEKKELVDSIVDKYISDTCACMTFVSKRLLSLFERLRRNAHIFVKSISREMEDSDFIPRFFEMKISGREEADLPAVRIKLSDGSEVYINGQIDRVDAFERDGKVYFRVIDYKTGKKEFSLKDIEKGINLQMFLYLFAIIENKEKFLALLDLSGELVPSATLYYLARLNTATHSELKSTQELEADVIRHIERKGAFLDDSCVIQAISHSGDMSMFPVNTDLKKHKGQFFTLESLCEIEKSITETVKNIAEAIKRGEASAIPNKELNACRYCRMKYICRTNGEGDEEDE